LGKERQESQMCLPGKNTTEQENTFVKTSSRVYKGQLALQHLVMRLIEASQWFAVTPLPGDYWEVKVKPKNRHLLKQGE